MSEVATLVTAPRVSSEELELVKQTVAQGATDAELRLYLFDCARQQVHPLDRLVHFTKRSGKYVPITSIDFMRIRAASSNECAGIDDAVFSGAPKTPEFCASVTVYRLVQGHRCAFTATARWSEYKPESHDFMWQKMPFVMLGKCAEALALRRGFPQQLAGLYAKEELDQAESVSVIETPEPQPISKGQQRKLFAAAKSKGWPITALREMLLDTFHAHRSTDVTTAQFDQVLMRIDQGPPVAPADQPF